MSKKPKQEPVAWMYVNLDGECEQIVYGTPPTDDDSITPLYAAPSAAAAISSALAAPEPEPVAYFNLQKQVFYWARPTMIDVPMTVALNPLPLYAAPPAAAPEPVPVAVFDGHLGHPVMLPGAPILSYEQPLFIEAPDFAPSEDIEALRRENERLRGLLAEAQKAVWMNYDGDLLDRIESALKEVPR